MSERRPGRLRSERSEPLETTGSLADADWPALLPAHRADGDDQPVGRPRCVDTMDLTEGLILAVVEDGRGRTYPVPLVVTDSAVRRATPGDGASEALIALLAAGDRWLDNFEITAWHHASATGERGIDVDQTNESVVVGDQAVVKWTFLADDGPHPAPSLLAELERSCFTGTPRPWGAVQWRPAEGAPPRLFALVVGFLPGAVDGWTWVVDDLREAAEAGDEPLSCSAGTAVGELVASFHLALARTARPSTVEETTAWRSAALADLDRALSVTRGQAHGVLARHVADMRAAFAEMPSGESPVMRVHGDLHVGQVLRAGDGTAATYALTDFDGNPVAPPHERATEQPAALDVAGMAQSFTHAGLVVRKHSPGLDADAVERVADAARVAFVEAYRRGLGDRVDLFDERLLRPFALRQVCREFTYAATHLPRWSYVPEAALPMLLKDTA